jgi:hypothetical protein
MKYWVTWEDLKGRQGEQEFDSKEEAQEFARLMRLQRLFAVSVGEEFCSAPSNQRITATDELLQDRIRKENKSCFSLG